MIKAKNIGVLLTVLITFCLVSACSYSSDKVYKAESNNWKATLRVSDNDQGNVKLRIEHLGVINQNTQSFKYELASDHEHIEGTEENTQPNQPDKFVYEKGLTRSSDFLPNENGEFRLKLNMNGETEELILK